MLSTVRVEGGATLTLGDLLGVGGEGVVFGVRESPRFAVKLYRQATEARVARLRDALRTDPSSFLDGSGRYAQAAWPIAAVLAGEDRVVGFAMLRFGAPQHVGFDDVVDAGGRGFAGLTLRWDDLARVVVSLGNLLAQVHRHGWVIGDLSARNVMITPTVAVAVLTDCDSMLREMGARVALPARVLTAETAAPELLASEDGEVTRYADSWAFAVLACRALMEGDHPFLGVPRDQSVGAELTSAANVRAGRTRLADEADLVVPRAALPVELLPPDVRALAVQCFVEGLKDPTARPAGSQWATVLEGVLAAVRACPDAPERHVFPGHLGACPWCERVAAGLPDPYPPHATPSRQRPPEAPPLHGGRSEWAAPEAS